MTFLFLLLLVAPRANVRPAAPTVGDPVEIRLAASPGASVSVDSSESLEVVSAKGTLVTVRAFAPGDTNVTGTVHERSGDTKFRVVIHVRSVLKPDDKLQPAPLHPPKELPQSDFPWKMIGGAAAVAAIAWALLAWAARRRAYAASPAARLLSATAEFRTAVLAIRRLPPADENIAALGDAIRRFFARIEGPLGRDLTTSEVVKQLGRAGVESNTLEVVREILGEADLAKFSPWGPHHHDSPALAERALQVAELGHEEGAA